MSGPHPLPPPAYDAWAWQERGACRDAEAEAFFSPEAERGRKRRDRAARAKAVCARCEVLTICRSYALAVREPYGVWGGLTPEERQEILLAEETAVAS